MKTKNILPPRIFQLSLLAIIAIHLLKPVWFIYNSSLRFIGLPLVLYGNYLNIYSDWLIKKHKTTIKPFEKPTYLIEKGQFQYTRNPIYSEWCLFF